MTIALEELQSKFTLDTGGLKVGALAATAAIGAVVAAIGVAVNSTAKWAEGLDELSDKLGISTEQAAGLKLVSQQTGVSQEELSRGFNALSKAMISNQDEFENMGIEIKDANGVLKSAGEVIGDVAIALDKLPDGVQKTNLEMAFFGAKNGPKFYDMLKKIATAPGGLKSFNEQAKKMGLVLSDEVVAAFERVGQKTEFVKLQLQGFANVIGSKLVHIEEWGLDWLSEKLSDPRILEWLDKFTDKLSDALDIFMDWATAVGDAAIRGDWSRVIELFKQGLGELIPDPSGFLGKIDAFVGGIIDKIAAAIERWAAGDGPQKLTDKLISWIDNFGRGTGFNSKILAAVIRLVNALGEAFRQVDWRAIQEALEERITEMFDASRPRGQDAFADWWDALEVTGTDNMRNFWNNLEAKGTEAVRNFFNKLEVEGTAATRRWGVAIYNEIVVWVNKVIHELNRISIIQLPALPTLGTTGSGTSNQRGAPPRATGGPVIAGQPYNVAEFYKPEVFRPNTSGRVDPMKPQLVIAKIDSIELASVLTATLAKVMD